MVSAKQGNGKRKNGNKAGNAKKFKAGPGNSNHNSNNNSNLKQRINNVRAAGIGAMFNPSQMLDNPGYMDFNEPAARLPNQKQQQFKNNNNNNLNGGGGGGKQNRGGQQRRQNNNNNSRQRNQGGNRNSNVLNGGGVGGRWNGNGPRNGFLQSNNMMMRQGPPNMGPFRGSPLPPRMHLMGPIPPPMGMLPPMPPPLPPHMAGRFGPPRPLIPPPMARNMPPMGPMRRPPHMRMGPMPLRKAIRPIPGPLRRGGGGKGVHKNGNNQNQRRGTIANQKNLKNRRKGQQKGGAKKTNQIIDKYPLSKPWVNDEIKAAHQAKVDLENQLKGKKNDEIFAQFKVQRDKFVSLYDAAKDAYLVSHPEAVKVCTNTNQIMFYNHFFFKLALQIFS